MRVATMGALTKMEHESRNRPTTAIVDRVSGVKQTGPYV